MDNAEVAVTRISLKKRSKGTVLSRISRNFMGSLNNEIDEELKFFVRQCEDDVKNSRLEDEKMFEEIDNDDDILIEHMNLFGGKNKTEVYRRLNNRKKHQNHLQVRLKVYVMRTLQQ